jgi:predicted nucleic acid-binding protein
MVLGVLLLAKQQDKLPQIKPVLNQLVQIKFRVSPEILSAVLRLADECD